MTMSYSRLFKSKLHQNLIRSLILSMSQHSPTIDATVPDVMDIINIQIIFTVVHDHVFYRLGTVVKSITCVLYRNIIFLFRPFRLLFPKDLYITRFVFHCILRILQQLNRILKPLRKFQLNAMIAYWINFLFK
jgi:hypothetical protein